MCTLYCMWVYTQLGKCAERFSFPAETCIPQSLTAYDFYSPPNYFSPTFTLFLSVSDFKPEKISVCNLIDISRHHCFPFDVLSGVVLLHPFPFACARGHECCAAEGHPGIRGDIAHLSRRAVHTGVTSSLSNTHWRYTHQESLIAVLNFLVFRWRVLDS